MNKEQTTAANENKKENCVFENTCPSSKWCQTVHEDMDGILKIVEQKRKDGAELRENLIYEQYNEVAKNLFEFLKNSKVTLEPQKRKYCYSFDMDCRLLPETIEMLESIGLIVIGNYVEKEFEF